MNYKQQLKSKNWKLKREEILERDNYCCQECNSKYNLQIHHKKYISGRMAWDYPNSFLITYCGNCHLYLHSKETIITLKDTRKKAKVEVKKIKPKKPKKTIAKKRRREAKHEKKLLLMYKKIDAKRNGR